MNYLKQKLEEKNMTQTELGKRIGISRQYVCDMCNGRTNFLNMRLVNIYEISRALDLDLKEFIEEILK